MNVRLLSILLILPLINACAFPNWKRPEAIEIKTKAEERIRLDLPDPPPLTSREIKWVIITKDNAEQVFKDLESKGVDVVLFGLTDDGYEQLALTMAEIRNYIATQKTIIIKYKEYYEPKKPQTNNSK